MAITKEQAEREAGQAALRDLLAPFMLVDVFAARFAGTGVFAMTFPPYSFDGIVKHDKNVLDLAEATPVQMRSHLLDRAERILVVLDEAGWQLTEYPEMAFSGHIVERFIQTFGGHLVEPAKQGAIMLRMRFAVDRPA